MTAYARYGIPLLLVLMGAAMFIRNDIPSIHFMERFADVLSILLPSLFMASGALMLLPTMRFRLRLLLLLPLLFTVTFHVCYIIVVRSQPLWVIPLMAYSLYAILRYYHETTPK